MIGLYPLDSEALAQELVARLDPLVPAFLLIDPFLREPTESLNEAVQRCEDAHALSDARSAYWEATVFPVSLSDKLRIPRHQHPYVVECSMVRPGVLEETVRLAVQERGRALATGLAPYCIGGWLQSTSAPDELCATLSRLSQLRTSPSTLAAARYLRIADRRALGLLCHVLGPEQIMTRLPGLDRWLWLDDAAGLRAIERSGVATTEPLVIDRAAWQRLANGSDLHPVRARLIGLKPDAASQFDRIEAALEAGRAVATRWPARFTTARDVQDWALLTLLFGDLKEHPEVIRILAHGDLECPELPGEPPEPFHLLLDAAIDAARTADEKSPACGFSEERT